jgi:hypothetical protein
LQSEDVCKPVGKTLSETVPDTGVTPTPDGNIGHNTDVATVPETRRPDGRFATGNKVSQTHGRRARKGLTRPEDSDLYREWSRDLGHDLSAPEAALLRRAAEAELICQSAFNYIANSRQTLSSNSSSCSGQKRPNIRCCRSTRR